MKTLNKILMIGIALFASNCTQPGSTTSATEQKMERPKTFNTVADAAKAAKADMLAAMEQKVNFGVDKEALRGAEPGAEISMMTLDPAMLMKADTGMHLNKLAMDAGKMLVPFVNIDNVAAVAFLSSSDNQFNITGLGDKFLTDELKTVYLMNQKMQGRISIVQVQNLNATLYLIGNPKGSENNPHGGYVLSSYNGHNLREPLNEREFMAVLAKDARMFIEQYGAQLKKDKLVR